jgi:D-cysteine desulfhydrase family pyridoxal phosphate-dependent enzyme
MGGNKARQLEFYFGEALVRGADTVVITGAVQSNYVRTAAAAAAKLGLACEIQLEERVADMDEIYQRSGNVLLDRLFGARLHTYPEGEDEAGADAALEAIAERVRRRGRVPYVIHLSEGHQPLGALGYVAAAHEILAQGEDEDVDFEAIVVASGSGATHAGLLVGLAAAGRRDIAVHGICVRRDAEAQAGRVLRVVRATCDELDAGDLVEASDVRVHDDWLAPGYGKPSGDTLAAIRTAARHEGLLLDPVYSGKAFAGVLGLAGRGEFAAGSRVLFIHTGGTPALFAYRSVLEEAL